MMGLEPSRPFGWRERECVCVCVPLVMKMDAVKLTCMRMTSVSRIQAYGLGQCENTMHGMIFPSLDQGKNNNW
jgi:hypothetical protein